MLPVKVEMRCSKNEFVSLPKLEPSRNVTGHIAYRIKARKSKSTEQYDCKLFFCSTAHVTQWSNYLTEQAEILTQRSNLTPQRGEEYCEWFVCGTEVTFDISRLASHFPLFSPQCIAVMVVEVLNPARFTSGLYLSKYLAIQDCIFIQAPNLFNYCLSQQLIFFSGVWWWFLFILN